MAWIRVIAALAWVGSCGVASESASASARQVELSEEEQAVFVPYARMSQEVRALLGEEEVEEAHRRVEEELREIEADRGADPEGWVPAARLAFTLTSQMELALRTREAWDAAEICEAILARQRELVRAFPGDTLIASRLLTGHDIAIRSLLDSDPDRAERFFPSWRAAIDAMPTEGPGWGELVARHEGMYKSRQDGIARIRYHRSLIGGPAPLLPGVGDWANGDRLAGGDLEGKVVLLDFWAVYCVPCIDAFPELTRWQEEYGGRGLVVVGVTGCFGYRWDEELKQAIPTEGQSRGDDLRTLDRFAAHHGLNYRILAEPEGSPLHEAYKIGSIPSTVLIDREGKVRLIEVGSGPDELRAIGEMIGRLLGDS
ncbi:TlpA disulfide reductase family protein [Tautonia sp. JC769]|uniref:TlpA family protein disulfide reductase n=1 Tax=Tautonia sp. JC769 TaxID=3232135 RepID=UPI00345A09BF